MVQQIQTGMESLWPMLSMIMQMRREEGKSDVEREKLQFERDKFDRLLAMQTGAGKEKPGGGGRGDAPTPAPGAYAVPTLGEAFTKGGVTGAAKAAPGAIAKGVGGFMFGEDSPVAGFEKVAQAFGRLPRGDKTISLDPQQLSEQEIEAMRVREAYNQAMKDLVEKRRLAKDAKRFDEIDAIGRQMAKYNENMDRIDADLKRWRAERGEVYAGSR